MSKFYIAGKPLEVTKAQALVLAGNIDEINRLKSINSELVECLEQCLSYVDSGNYKENATQFELYMLSKQALTRAKEGTI